jgi:hypothetical protein
MIESIIGDSGGMIAMMETIINGLPENVHDP